MSNMTPREIVHELDKHIIGQQDAKRAVAIALRNRWRRMQLPEALRAEITPKNILMIGPTGVGKTEIARRLAKLANAPFVKVEATKFTEVGYVGRDVESIIRDLADVAVKLYREQEMERVQFRAEEAAEERLLDILLPPARGDTADSSSGTRQMLRKKLREGDLDDKEVEVNIASSGPGMEIMAPPGMEEMTNQLQSMFSNISRQQSKARRMPVKAALKALRDEEAAKLVNEDDLKQRAIHEAEQNGIVFIDELDKVAKRGETAGADVSREGVQRDLLPLIEGSTVTTKHGTLKTDHILFIASGRLPLGQAFGSYPRTAGSAAHPCRAGFTDGKRLRAHSYRARCFADGTVSGTAGHRRAAARVHSRRPAAYCRDGLESERENGEHWRPSPAYRDGAAVGAGLLWRG